MGVAGDATLAALQHIGYVQIDTISVIQRARHHGLWSRSPRNPLRHFDQTLEEKRVYEYGLHVTVYLPMRDYRYSRYTSGATLAFGYKSF